MPARAFKKAGKWFEKKITSPIVEGTKDLFDPGRHERAAAEYRMQSAEQRELADNQFLRDYFLKMMDERTGIADSWASDYLNFLRNSPDTAFSAGLSSLNRGLSQQRNDIAQSMSRRGLAGSGVSLDAIAQTGANRARGISALQGQRVDRTGQNIQAGAAFTGARHADAQGGWLSTFGKDTGASQAYTNYLSQQAQRGGGVGDLVGHAAKLWLDHKFPIPVG